MLKIYIRKDLNMRKGKMGAQASHALMAAFLSFVKSNNDFFYIENSDYNFIFNALNKENIDVVFLEDEKQLLNMNSKNMSNSVMITDQGRTEFGGVATNTCLAVFSDSNIEVKRIDCSKDTSEEYFTKQTIVFNKDLFKGEDKIDKSEYVIDVACNSMKALLSIFSVKGNKMVLDKSNLAPRAWLEGSFAKIVLQTNSLGILMLVEKLKKINFNYAVQTINGTPSSVALSPNFDDEINKITSEYKLF